MDEARISLRQNTQQPPESVLLLIGPALGPIAADLRSKGATVFFLDSQSLLVGEWNAVNRALQRVAAPAATPGPLERRARELWVNDDVWFVANGAFASSLLGPNTAVPTGVSRISIGMSWREKLTFDLLLHTVNPTDADRLAERYRRSPGELGLPGGEGGVRIQKSSDGVSARLSLEASQIPDSLRQQLAEQLRPVLQLARQGTPHPARKAVVIQGLDNGPRVVPAPVR